MRLADCTAALVHRDAKHGETSAQNSRHGACRVERNADHS